jgi:pyruvate/2-oxoglutarate dehydrogenase complex dihydrolipoamide dehydrogenase (E3) component
MLVIGGGATGAQVASIFNAFGSRVELFHSGPRILPTEDADVSAAVARAFREAGMVVREAFGTIERFEKTVDGVRLCFASKRGVPGSAEAALAVAAVGWEADTTGLDLEAAGVKTNEKGFVVVDASLRTSAPHIFAAGDITGRLMLAPQAIQDGFVAATNAVRGTATTVVNGASPIGSFTDPEYAQVGLTEAKAREARGDVVVALVRFDETTRTIIDGRTAGFCKLVADRTGAILGCHVVGERAVEIVQAVAIAMTAGMRVDALAQVPLSFPTYAGILGRAAYRAARQAGLDLAWQQAPHTGEQA